MLLREQEKSQLKSENNVETTQVTPSYKATVVLM